MDKLFANSGYPDQMLHSAASDLGLHCLPVTLLGVSRLKWVKILHQVVKWSCSMFRIHLHSLSRAFVACFQNWCGLDAGFQKAGFDSGSFRQNLYYCLNFLQITHETKYFWPNRAFDCPFSTPFRSTPAMDALEYIDDHSSPWSGLCRYAS